MENELAFSFQVDSELAQKAYRTLKNYFVVDEPSGDPSLCAIYFSSNDLYYPNTEAVFKKQIFDKDRYEWYPTRIANASKHIFVRDIRKQWYLSGINAKASTLEELASLLEEEAGGRRIITIGSSAGGYAAILMGHYLNADRILAFNPQFSIEDILQRSTEAKDPIVFRNADELAFRQFYNIAAFVSPRVFYFCSMNSGWDKEQVQFVVDRDLHIIRFRTANHGIPFPRTLLSEVINLNAPELKKLAAKPHHPLVFSIQRRGLIRTVQDLAGLLLKRYRKKRLEKIEAKING